ncbi:MAG: porphobilinogen synthase, partial [Chloroflexi bacterium]
MELADRPRRLRATAASRALVRETRLSPRQLVAPVFLVPGRDRREPIPSMPGHERMSPDLAVEYARRLAGLHVGGLLLFGVPDQKDDLGDGAADADGPVPATLRLLRDADLPLVLIADVCLCEYTSHGHCGVLDGRRVDNDRTLPLLAAAAVAYAQAGADIVAPSA